MISRIRERLGAAGLVVAIVALVAVLAGGAYAASGALSGKQKKEVQKIAQKEAKKLVKAGPTGPAGAKGEKGDPGTAGKDGTNGTNGKSVVLGTAGGECSSGGVTVEVEGSGSKKPICNGQTGFTETLPSEKTETGTWSVTSKATAEFFMFTPVSFTVPLAEKSELIYVELAHKPNGEPLLEEGEGHPGEEELKEALEEGAEHGCPGFENGVPMASPGKLCVYSSLALSSKPTGVAITPTKLNEPQIYEGSGVINKPDGAGTEEGKEVLPSGTTLQLRCTTGACKALGTWAVTAK